MYYPELYTVSKSRDMTAIFGGLNKTHTCTDGEWISEDGLTSQYYPTLSVKKSDAVVEEYSADRGNIYAVKYLTNDMRVAVYEKCAVVSGDNGETVINRGFTGGNISITEMGNNIIVYPHKIWISKTDIVIEEDENGDAQAGGLQWGDIENETYASSVTISLTKLNGGTYDKLTVSAEAPTNPTGGDYWLDTGETEWLYFWDDIGKTWQSVSTVYLRIEADGIGDGFSQYDTVDISFGVDSIPTELAKIPGLFAPHTIYEVEENAIVVAGWMPASQITYTGSDYGYEMTFSRNMPQMDFVFAHKNRLWGCRYGSNMSYDPSKPKVFVSEIYASKLGDFKNWYAFEGISTDSWTATIGTGAEFTGALVYNDRPTFFKEDRIITVTGDVASEFRTSELVCESISEWGVKSPQVVNGVLYYVSRYGICAYTGGFPTRISDALGYNLTLISNASAVSKDTYCLWARMATEDDQNYYEWLIEYDTSKGIWHTTKTRTDTYGETIPFEAVNATQDAQGFVRLIAKNGSALNTENSLYAHEGGFYNRKWFAESGLLTMSYPGAKRVSAFRIRAELAEDAKADFYIRYEDDDEWRLLDTLCGIPDKSIHTFTIRNLPRRCDHYRMRFEGVGKCKIYSICYDIEQGGY